MQKKRIFLIGILGVMVLGVVFFYWYTQRQANYAKTRELFAPLYEYSGRLTPAKQKSFSELVHSIELKTSGGKGYALSERERLQLEAHSMTLYRNNPELMFRNSAPFPADTDVEPYIRHFSIVALIAKTKLANFPTDSRKSILSHLDALAKRLTKNSVEIYIQEIKNLPFRPKQKVPTMRFGIASVPGTVGNDNWIFEADGSFTWQEGTKRGVFQIVDVYGNEYAIDLDAPTDTRLTEDASELYAEIDSLFEQLTDAEFQRLSTLNQKDMSIEIEKLFSSK